MRKNRWKCLVFLGRAYQRGWRFPNRNLRHAISCASDSRRLPQAPMARAHSLNAYYCGFNQIAVGYMIAMTLSYIDCPCLPPQTLPVSSRQLAAVGAAAGNLPKIFMRTEDAGKRFW